MPTITEMLKGTIASTFEMKNKSKKHKNDQMPGSHIR